MEGYSNNLTVAKESNSEITYQLTWQMLPQKFKEKYIGTDHVQVFWKHNLIGNQASDLLT